MKSSSLFAIVTSVVLASTSAAQANCHVFFGPGEGVVLGSGTCLFMGSQEDYAAWGADSCNGMANVMMAPEYNDELFEVLRTSPGGVTVMKNVMRDENVLYLDSTDTVPRVFSGDWENAASVLLCH